MKDLTTPQRFYVIAFVLMASATISVNVAMNSGSKLWAVITAALMVTACAVFLIGLTRETRD